MAGGRAGGWHEGERVGLTVVPLCLASGRGKPWPVGVCGCELRGPAKTQANMDNRKGTDQRVDIALRGTLHTRKQCWGR